VTFELVSKYWAAPLSNVILVLLAIIVLYPVIWNVSVRQLREAIDALNAAKQLPTTIAELTAASARLQDVNRDIIGLRDTLGDLDAINLQLEKANRQIADLQKLSEERPPEVILDGEVPQENVNDELANWDAVSKLWFDVKDYVEDKIERITDGRKRRKYNPIPRYTYSEITALLQSDEVITPDEAAAIDDMDRAFRSLRNRKTPVTPDRVAAFQAWHDQIVGHDAAAAVVHT